MSVSTVVIACALLGGVVGQAQGRATEGYALGLLLGALWVLLTALVSSPDKRVEVLSRAGHAFDVPPTPTQRPQAFRASSEVCRGIRDTAAAEPDWAVLNAAIDCFTATIAPQRPVTDWFFTSGRSLVVIRYDEMFYACTPTFVGKFAVKSPAEYSIDSSRDIVNVTLGPYSFDAVHPQQPALSLLSAANATCLVDFARPPSIPAVVPEVSARLARA